MYWFSAVRHWLMVHRTMTRRILAFGAWRTPSIGRFLVLPARQRLWVGALVLLAMASACKDSEPERPGRLVVTTQTDMSVPGGIDTIELRVEIAGEVRHEEVFEVAPTGDQKIPFVYELAAAKEPTGDVTITVVGRLGDEARVFARVDTTFPEDQRTAVVELPLQWLCTGQVEEREGAYTSSCEPIKDQPAVCVAGECQVAALAERSLPDYRPQNVFGGASRPGEDGACFPTETCFAVPTVVVPNADCQVEVDGTEQDVNLALQLPTGIRVDGNADAGAETSSAGICNASGCFVPLDHDRRLGYSFLAGPATDAGVGKLRVGLPKAVCTKLDAGDIVAVVATNACVTKTPRTPTCGAWSSTENVLDVVLDPIIQTDASTDAAVTPDAGEAGESDELTLIIEGEYDGGALGIGATIQLIVEGVDAKDVTWTSSDEDVATVDQKGRVKVVGVGTAIITATVDGKTVTFEITGVETDGDDDEITIGVIAQVTYLMLDPQQAMIPAGASVDITARGTLQNGRTVTVTDEVTWSSSDEDVASVEAGRVVGLQPGEVTIRAEGNGLAAEATVLVSDASLALLTVNPSEVTLPAGVTQTLVATATYSNGQSLEASASAQWSSGNADIVEVDDNGVITALSIGETLVTAELDGKTDTVFVKVTDAVLAGLSVEPAALDLYVGQRSPLVATAQYSDGQRVNVSGQVEWQSNDTDIATVAFEPQLGLRVTGVAEGSTTLTGTFGDQTVEVAVKVSAVSLSSLVLAPDTLSLPLGANTALVLMGHYEDGKSVDVTEDAEWSTGNPRVATILSNGTVVAQGLGTTDITARLGGLEAKSRVTVTDARLLGVSLTPRDVTLIAGLTARLTATASYSDGRSVALTTQGDWSSSTTAVVVSDTGLLTGNTPGSAVVTVTFGGFSATTNVTVSDATLESLVVTAPETSVPSGNAIALTAEARYTDGSTFDVTTDVVWRSDDTRVGTVSSAGLFTGNAPGEVQVSATLGARTASIELVVTNALPVDIQITPNRVSLARGTSRTLTAVVEYSDGTSRAPGAGAQWTSRNQTVATVNNNGVVQALAEGATEVALTFAGLERRANITVTAATPTQLTITADANLVAAGQSVRFTALVTYSDGSSTEVTSGVTWRSLSPTIASVSPSGVALSTAPGTAVIEGTFGDLVDTESFAVMEAAVQTLEITPTSASVARGNTVQFTAVATYTDGLSLPVTTLATWRSGSNSIATVSGGGLARGVAAGSTTLTASFGGQTATAQFTVRNAELTGIRIIPGQATVAATTTVTFVAEGDYTDGTRATVSPTWSTSNVEVASINNQGGARGVRPGEADVVANLSGFQAQAHLTVTDVPLVGLQIQPINPSIPLGTTLQFSAIGTYGDGTTAPVQATYTSSNRRLSIDSTGLARTDPTRTDLTGPVNVTATFGELTSTTSAQVTPGTITGLTITPSTASVIAGRSVTLSATATYTDGRSPDVSPLVEWRTSKPDIATVIGGVVTTRAPGSAMITATYLGETAQANITVTNAVLEEVIVELAEEGNQTSAPLGRSIALRAQARYSDGSRLVIPNPEWGVTGNEPLAFSVNASGVARATALGTADVTATFGGLTGSLRLTATDAELVGLAINPQEAQVIQGRSTQLNTTATYSDGTSRQVNIDAAWTTSDGRVASIQAGLVLALTPGNVTISAGFGGRTATARVTVVAASVTSVVVTSPNGSTVPAGLTRQLVATANYNNGTSQVVTSDANWSSSSSLVTVNQSGLATGVAAGPATVSAQFSGVTGSLAMEVTSAQLTGLRFAPTSLQLPEGRNAAVVLWGTYTNGSEQNLTAQATWSSANSAVASFDGGRVYANNVGSTTIRASVGSFTANLPVTVQDAVVDSVTVTPTTGNVPAGTTITLRAEANYSNGETIDVTSDATWTSASPTVARVDGGMVTGVVAGSTAQIRAAFGGATGSATVTVTAAIVTRVIVSPASISVPLGVDQQLTARAVYSDGSEATVTTTAIWQRTSGTSVSVSASGVARPTSLGASVISATFEGVTGSSTVTGTPAIPTGLTLTPPTGSVIVGTTVTLTATERYSDGSTQSATTRATWTTSDGTRASVNNGVVTGVVAGATPVTITASVDGFTATASVVVVAASITSIAVSGEDLSVPVGLTRNVTAIATYNNNTTRDVTAEATWASSSPTIMTVTRPAGSAFAVVRGNAAGSANVTATVGSVVGSATITVTNAVVQGVRLTPTSLSLIQGQQGNVRLFAQLSSGTEQEVTTAAGTTWGSSNSDIASVATGGVVRGNGAGSVTIFGDYQNFRAEARVTVTGVVRLRIAPPDFTLNVGEEQPLRVLASLSNNQEADVTPDVSWDIDFKDVVTLDNNSVAVALAPGETWLTATYAKLEARTLATVLDNRYDNLVICPGELSVPVGGKYALAVMGETEGGDVQDISQLVSWEAEEKVLSFDDAGTFTALAESRLETVIARYAADTQYEQKESATVSSYNSDGVYLEADPPVVRLDLGGDPQPVRIYFTSRQTRTDVTANIQWDVNNEKLAELNFDKESARLFVYEQGNLGCTFVRFTYQQRTIDVPITISGRYTFND